MYILSLVVILIINGKRFHLNYLNVRSHEKASLLLFQKQVSTFIKPKSLISMVPSLFLITNHVT